VQQLEKGRQRRRGDRRDQFGRDTGTHLTQLNTQIKIGILLVDHKQKIPSRLVLGQVFWVRRGIKPQREYSLGDLCEDSVAQTGPEIGFFNTGHEWRDATSRIVCVAPAFV
jgi:hypothetical protein